MKPMNAVRRACAMLLLAAAARAGTNEFLVLCYHDIPNAPNMDRHAVALPSLIQQLEYLRAHGYRFVSADDVFAAHRGEAGLPDKAVLMTFDDGYATFRTNVLPVLDLYDCPAVLAVCSAWTENGPPPDITAPLMGWEEVREAVAHPLVTLASHSHDLHRALVYNPQGNTAPAASCRRYFAETGAYETERQFRRRVRQDLEQSRALLAEKTGATPRILVWPYGEFNGPGLSEARKAGFEMAMTLLSRPGDVRAIEAIGREMLMDHPTIRDFADSIRAYDLPERRTEESHTRAIQVDLDLIYDASPGQTERNLDRFLDRVVAMNVEAVYLQAFADVDADGNVSAVYFPNRVLPMRGDLLSRVANQLYIRGIVVYAWMPVLAVDLPDAALCERLRVREAADGETRPSTSWYRRLSPFSREAQDHLVQLYEDMAAHVRLHGVLFQDDAYLTDHEDLHPDAVRAVCAELGIDELHLDRLTPEQKARWTRIKTRQLGRFTEALMAAVRRYRPGAGFARNLYAPVLYRPHSEEWFAQNYADALSRYDRVVVMAYPEMEKAAHPLRWLEQLVAKAARHPGALERTVFKLQAYDWSRSRWIDDAALAARIRRLAASGARRIAYYPDNYTIDRPALDRVRPEMSGRALLFPRPRRPRRAPPSADRGMEGGGP